MKNIVTLSIAILFYFGSLLNANAAAPLSQDDINHFINAMKPLQALGQELDKDQALDKEQDSINNKMREEPTASSSDFTGLDNISKGNNPSLPNFAPMSHALTKMKGHPAYGKFQSILHNAGFSSPEQWARIGDRIMRAYMSRNMLKSMTPQKTLEIMKTIEEVEENEYLSSETKKHLLNSMKAATAMTRHIPAEIKADQDALKPSLAKLDRLFKEK